MKNKVLIIQANYYKDISTALLKSAKNELKNFAKIMLMNLENVTKNHGTIRRPIRQAIRQAIRQFVINSSSNSSIRQAE